MDLCVHFESMISGIHNCLGSQMGPYELMEQEILYTAALIFFCLLMGHKTSGQMDRFDVHPYLIQNCY